MLRRRRSDGADSSWVERYVRPLLTLFALVGVILGCLQVWIATKFVTKDELEKFRVDMRASHADHMQDYLTIEDGIERLNRTLHDRLPERR